ncbi:hypothetical protein TorRG33x02_136750 [Trema orientale]|uniref:Uncharacterized protein n=1 Tax=Trema orientale TaxID=63057 RepID=A0A2P5EYL1_TREOI|nr:hypothetical protein TorRG33x02_136750 [Trema orientale]
MPIRALTDLCYSNTLLSVLAIAVDTMFLAMGIWYLRRLGISIIKCDNIFWGKSWMLYYPFGY